MHPGLTIDLLRHGETTAGPCFLGATDAPLSDTGWQQMRRALEDRSCQEIITSPMKRCADFAQWLAQDKKIRLHIEDDLREMHFGDWDGQNTEQLWQTQQPLLEAFWQDPENNPPPNGEVYGDFRARVNGCFQRLRKNTPGTHILLIAHGGVIRQILASVLCVSLKNIQSLRVDHGSLSRLRCYPDSTSIEFINYQAGGAR